MLLLAAAVIVTRGAPSEGPVATGPERRAAAPPLPGSRWRGRPVCCWSCRSPYNLLFTMLGRSCWPFAVPYLARAAAEAATTPARHDAIEVTFQTLNRHLGMAVGEHVGYLFTGVWTALVGVALLQSNLLHPLLGIVGLVLAPLFVLGSLEFVGPFEPGGWKLAGTLVPLAYIGWSLWLLALGIAFLVTA